MASESSEELTMSVQLPAELVEWLDEAAADAEVDRETLITQLLASYRTVADVNEETDPPVKSVDPDSVAESVKADLGRKIERQVNAELSRSVEDQVDDVLTDRLTEATSDVREQVDTRIDTVEGTFQEDINDVRNRVIQVKKEADNKAPKDHSHPEMAQLSVLQDEVDSLQTRVDELENEHEADISEVENTTAEQKEQVDEIQDRLQTVAWVVSDLREAQQSSSGLEAVERIKRAAARADIERANCENCGQAVSLALLTDPHCPHCDTTVTNVEPSSGWFGSPKLTVASQLESGESE
ncbi:hypothetical protein ACFQJ7_11750 [Halovenus rubra]|uniref:Uncharacterized protein n=2 Tax=Halovenus rubra TaxID=869890 RepID=A0ACC7E0K3_9EURY|nr:hypothetical protein [Halovenus rubra]